MVRKLRAVYEDGVLKPVGALPLDEHQLVSVIVIDGVAPDKEPDEELTFEAPDSFERLADHSISLQAVREALSKIPGSLDTGFVAERNER
ncbi:MAG: antitoxin AF2212-like protein [Bryobacteraceae bacterium]